jgi:hypothetical protein
VDLADGATGGDDEPAVLDRATRALQEFGYTDRESAFLELAALHSGYFVRRQFNRFIGHERGGLAAAFVKKLIDRKHATRDVAIRHAHVYHVSAKPLYVALGQPDNRHRRRRSPFGIKSKLMALDYVLDHGHGRLLATEHERVEYFLGRGVERDRLPHLTYRPAKQGPCTDRYFVEKFPLSIHDTPQGAIVSLTYVDAGESAVDGFDTFLRRYAALIEALLDVTLVYVADTDRNFAAARRCFEAWRQTLPSPAGISTDAKSVAAMLRHFCMRQRVDANQLATSSVPQLREFREERPRFATPETERLYGVWKEGGEAAVRAVFDEHANTMPLRVAALTTVRLEHDYSFLGTVGYAW